MNHTCPICGKEFVGRKDKKYCSPACKNAAEIERKREGYKAAQPTERICDTCGKRFTAIGKKYYCSEACREQAYRKAHPQINCVVCGRPFDRRSTRSVCCSPECQERRHNQLALEHMRSIRAESPRKRSRSDSMREIERLALEAQQRGMTYGQYIARIGGDDK